MARRISRKSLKHDEFVEAAFDFGTWVEENWKSVAMVAAAVVGVVLIGYAWIAYGAHRQNEANRLFGEGFLLYQGPVSPTESASAQERRQKALALFQEAADMAGGSPLADIATYYRGVIHLENGNPEEAARVLEELTGRASSPVVGDIARAKLAEACASGGDTEKAKTLWGELAEAQDSFFPQDQALLNLGKLLRQEGREEEARETFQSLVDRYPQGSSAVEARSLMERGPRG